MNIKNRYTVALCAAAFAVATPGWAQDVTISVPELHIDTNVLQIPEIRVDTILDTVPELVLSQSRDKLAAATELAAQAQALQAYTTGQVYQNLSSIYTPEMAKKTRDIALLRQMLALRLTARDIEKAIPLLKEMKDADKVAPV